MSATTPSRVLVPALVLVWHWPIVVTGTDGEARRRDGSRVEFMARHSLPDELLVDRKDRGMPPV